MPAMHDTLHILMNALPGSCCCVTPRRLFAGGLAAPPTADQAENLEAANPWAMLIRTFLPWVNAGQMPDYDEEAEGSEDGRDESQQDESQNAEAEADQDETGAAAADEDDDLD